ncbi:MAG: hypothetical protein KBC84_06035 [Proteobacteria bacterium]|nr:hypothetical protein [Pseudomonadota bacterium]
MVNSYSKLDQALKDLIEAYAEMEEELEAKHKDDDEALSHSMLEAVETSIEAALEEHDYSSSAFAGLLSILTEGLEQIDPAAFEDADEDDFEVDEDLESEDLDEDLDDDDDLELDDDDDYDDDNDDD